MTTDAMIRVRGPRSRTRTCRYCEASTSTFPPGSVFALLGSNGAGGRKATEYSGDMRRRLDIAMGLVGNSPVAFLDEPTTGLDPQARLSVWETIEELAQRGTTVLLTTQYLEEAERLADRIAVLHHGRIVVNGTLTELESLLPPARIEYIEKRPNLEEIFLAIVAGADESGGEETISDRSVATSGSRLPGTSVSSFSRSSRQRPSTGARSSRRMRKQNADRTDRITGKISRRARSAAYLHVWIDRCGRESHG